MKQMTHHSKSSWDQSDKEPHRKKASPIDYHNEPCAEDSNKPVGNHGRTASNFDSTNFSIFFNKKGSHSKGSLDSSTGYAHFKKKSSEATSSRESSFKRLSSKDSSNLEELKENTSIITNFDTFQNPRKNLIDLSVPQGQSDDNIELLQDDISKQQKEEKQEEQQEIINTIAKLGLESQEQEKVEPLVLKLPNTNINIEVIERIMTKSLPHHRLSMSNDPNSHNMSISGTSTYDNDPSKVRTNNTSVFQGSRPLRKDHNSFNTSQEKEIFGSTLRDPLRKSISASYSPFEPEIPFKVENQTPIKDPYAPKAQTSLLTKSLEAQAKNAKKGTITKQNLSTVASESGVGDEHPATFTFNVQNTSFSTPFSGKSISFNTSGKTDFNSPLQADSGRLAENLQNTPILNHQPASVPPFQRTLFNIEQKNLMVLYGGHGSGNNTDRSNSFSCNEEFPSSAYGSNMGTPQGIQQQSFFDRRISSIPDPLSAASQPIGSQAMRNRSSNNFKIPNQNMNQPVTQQSPSNYFNNNNKMKDQQNAQFSEKGNEATTSKSKKKAQEHKDPSQYEIDLNKLEGSSRTTLMVKNIPNKYDLPMLLEAIEKNHKGKYDFLYLPIDPRNKCNVGYAFINFTDPRYIKDFYLEFNAKKWERFNSEKICEIKYGRIQGKKALMNHFQYSNVMNQQDKKIKPYIPAEYELLDSQKIKDLVNKQKMESAGDICMNANRHALSHTDVRQNLF